MNVVASMAADWTAFDGWCSARGIDVMALPLDRAINVFIHAARSEARTQDDLDAIEEALEVPITARDPSGVPAWYGDDETAWEEGYGSLG